MTVAGSGEAGRPMKPRRWMARVLNEAKRPGPAAVRAWARRGRPKRAVIAALNDKTARSGPASG
jgi:hypothetical protein